MLRTERHLLASLSVQRHHIATPVVVEGGRHPGLAIQVVPTCAGDLHPLANEWAFYPDFLVEPLQCFCGPWEFLRRRQLVQPAGLLVVLRDAFAIFVTFLVEGRGGGGG